MTNKREQLLDRMIALYGYEHEAVIQFAELITRPQLSDETLETVVKCHEEKPLYILDEEDW